jgi:hypothetical protein
MVSACPEGERSLGFRPARHMGRLKMMIVIHVEKRMTDIILLVKHVDTSWRIHRGHVSSGEGGQP